MARSRKSTEGWYTRGMKIADEAEVDWLRQRWPDPTPLTDRECSRAWAILYEGPQAPKGERNTRSWVVPAFYRVTLDVDHHDERYKRWQEENLDRGTQRRRVAGAPTTGTTEQRAQVAPRAELGARTVYRGPQ